MAISKQSMILLAVLALGSACGRFEPFQDRKDGQTAVRFVAAGAASGSGGPTIKTLSGGVLVYAIGASGLPQKTIKLADESNGGAPATTVLQNGSYRFLALGYGTSGLTGAVYCGQANSGSAITLDGKATNVAITLAVAECASSAFTSDANYTDGSMGFDALKLVSCDSAVTNPTMLAFTGSSSCGGGNAGELHIGLSVRLALAGYSTSGGAPVAGDLQSEFGLRSDCIRGDGIPTSIDTTAIAGTGAQGVGTIGSSVVIFTDNSGGIFRSVDGGQSWANVASGFGGRQVAISGTRVIVSTNTDVQISNDSGASFTAALGAFQYWGVAVEGDVLVAGLYNGSGNVRISTNGGVSFSAAESTGNAVNIESVHIDSTTAGVRVLAAGGRYVARRAVGGGWSNLLDVGVGETANRVKIIDEKIYVGATNGLWVSTNDGSTFTQYCQSGCANTGAFPVNNVNDILKVGSTIYLATSDGLGVSIDGGATFSSANAYSGTNLAVAGANIYQLAYNGTDLFFNAFAVSGSARRLAKAGTGLAFPATAVHRLPYGYAGSPFAVRVDFYGDAVCSSLVRSQYFVNGLHGLNPTDHNAVYPSNVTESRLFLRRP